MVEQLSMFLQTNRLYILHANFAIQ